MGRLIKIFSDGSLLEFDEGRFDEWCIYHKFPNEEGSAVLDEDVFERLDKLGQKASSFRYKIQSRQEMERDCNRVCSSRFLKKEISA